MQAVSNNEDFKSYTKAQRNVQNFTQKKMGKFPTQELQCYNFKQFGF